MSDTIITATEDEITVIAAAEIPSLVIHSEAESRVIQVGAALSVIIQAAEPEAVVIEATGSGSLSGNYFRGIINYDGGFPDSLYGDAIHLDGGGVVDGRNHPI